MSTTLSTTTAAPTPPPAMTAAGWQPGPPPGVSEETIGIDQAAVKAMCCGGCRKRSLRFHVMHCPTAAGETLYGGFAACQRCGWTEDV